MRLKPLAALVLLLAPLPALAQGTPRSIGECERLKNDLDCIDKVSRHKLLSQVF